MITFSRAEKREYGVIKQGQDYIFTAAFDVKCCLELCIYTLDGQVITCFDISKCKLAGNVYSVCVSGLDVEGFQYEYICDENTINDPYMKRYSLKRQFGVEKGPKDIDRAVFIEDKYDFSDDVQLNLNKSEVIIYQLHVRGFTKHNSSKVKGKGCFKGITEKIPYFKELGINQIELMPAYDFYEFDSPLDNLKDIYPQYTSDVTIDKYGHTIENIPQAKLNYWGYKKANYFCPKQEYAYTSDAVKEFKDMVKALHSAGIEVVMQMYFERNEKSSLIIDCLRFWYIEYHVDGFHIMGERLPLNLILMDDLLMDAKLYINNLDKNDELFSKAGLTKNVYDVNERFKVSSRRYLKSDSDSLAEFVNTNRANPSKPYNINYITCYEGFTLNDLVAYEHKHNEANGHDNTDGNDYNVSWNCGVEGKSLKKTVKELRIRQIKNALCMLFLAQGTPMLFMGDEFLNTQDGNNNPYCQDNETTWLNWKPSKSSAEIFSFVEYLIDFRKNHPVLHQQSELKNMDYLKCGSPDISYHQDMAWKSTLGSHLLHIGMMLDGAYVKKASGQTDDSLYIAYNMHWENHMFGLPRLKNGLCWKLEFSTGIDSEDDEINSDLAETQDNVCVYKRSVMVLKAVPKTGKEEK